MGKIAALGGGRFDNGEMDNVTEHIISLTGKNNPHFLFIPTASFDNMDENDDVMLCFMKYGCTADILFLTHEDVTEDVIREKISSADGIFVQGGNLKFLMDTWKRTGADKIFKKAHEKGIILSGYSSGAMCWCEEGWDDCGENREFIFLDCIGLLPYCCAPHYDGDDWHKFKDVIKTRTRQGLAIDNGAAIVFKDDEIYTLHGNDGGKVYYLDNDGNETEVNS